MKCLPGVFLAAALAAGAPAAARTPEPTPVVARHGMVVAQEARAARIGADILRNGGNAVDAAVATGFALAVTYPRAGNIGGGGFMVIHLARGARNIAIDYRETAPAATTPDVFLDDRGEADPEKSRNSGLAIGVPGTVAGLALAHRKYGSGKFTLARLIAPAIALAREGFVVDGDLADTLEGARRLFARWPSSAKVFLKGDGTSLQVGDRLVQADLADTLSAIAARGPDAFYRGPVAQRIAAAVRAAGGRMTADDLRAYRAVKRRPVTVSLRAMRSSSVSSTLAKLMQGLRIAGPLGCNGSLYESRVAVEWPQAPMVDLWRIFCSASAARSAIPRKNQTDPFRSAPIMV